MRYIPITLQDHLDETGTTLCFLIKITASDGSILGITSLDQNITYNDGAGDLLYSAVIGVDQSALETSANLQIDNSEAIVLLTDAGPFSSEKIAAGVLDYGEFIVYRINWKTPSNGHYIVQTGTIGVVKNRDGLAGVIELRGLPQWLKQNYIDLYSVTCRAIFGSGGGGTDCLTFGQCGFDAASLWQSHSVSTVSTEEDDRVFVANSSPSVSGPNGALTFVPGLVQWLTGENVGFTSETEVVSGANIELRFGAPAPIQAGDTFKIRPDCSKRFLEDCIGRFDNFINFRGEPYIPLTDEGSQSTPNFTGTWGVSTVTSEPPP